MNRSSKKKGKIKRKRKEEKKKRKERSGLFSLLSPPSFHFVSLHELSHTICFPCGYLRPSKWG